MNIDWCNEHSIIVEDLEKVAADRVISWEKLRDKTVIEL